MDLRLPLVVVHRAHRLVEAFVPTLPGVAGVGPSLSELRDDLALMVMERFEQEPVGALAAYQLPPHASLEMVKVEAVAQDRVTRRRWQLEARLGVLLEKWPGDDFYVATPTRLPAARFALRHPDELEAALPRRLVDYCVRHRIETLEPFHAERRERLDILDVDADPPSIFPKVVRPPRRPARARKPDGDAAETPESREERRRRRRATVRALREVGRNLAHAAHDGGLERAYGREALVESLLAEFEQREGVAIVLVGPSGVGKTAVVHEFVRRLVARQGAHGPRRDVWRVDGNRFIAGMQYVGQWEARARELVEELADVGDVLYIDDLASMVYAGRTRKSGTNVAQYLHAHLARGELTVIAESTPERLERVREEAPTFASLFRVVRVEPMEDRETLPVLLGALRDAEADAAADGGDAVPARLAPDALEAVLHLTRRFAPHDAFPGKAVRLLRAVLAGGSSAPVGPDGVRRYTAANVREVVQRQTGLPSFVLGHGAPRRREVVRAHFAAMVAGQPDAVEAITDVVVAMQHALGDPEKPLATYLFVGPTGVGKTETAKALARYLFGDAKRMVRFDMSEFGSSASITRLVGHAGAPDGELTTALRAQPFSVVLFDEIEKAHPRVFDALLQLLGEGRLTDAAGRTADARQAVVVMTSNLGVREAAARAGFLRGDAAEARRHYAAAASRFFRPEFFNRIDRVVAFDSLGPAALRVVVEHALQELLSRRGIRRGNVLVDVEPELLDLLVEQAFDPRYGARPLRRALERRLAVPLAHHLVRRRTEDLALVHLYRRGDDMALAVQALRDAPALPPPPDESAWTMDDVAREFAAAKARLDALAQSRVVAGLADARGAELRAVGRGERSAGLSAGVELLERLGELEARARAIDEAELADGGDGFVEEAVAEDEYALWEHNRSFRSRRYRMGLRPRVGFIEIPAHTNAEATLRAARPKVAALRDDVEVLAFQLERVAAARAGEATERDDAATLLVEAVSPDGSTDELAEIVEAVPAFCLRAQRYYETAPAGPGGPGAWEAAPRPTKSAPARACVAVRGPGARALVEHLAGFALVTEGAGDTARTSLVRIEVLDGDGGPDAVRARDAARAAAHEARRRGDDAAGAGASGDVVAAQLPEGVITLRVAHPPAQGRPLAHHVATGLIAGACEAVAAAVLRARRGRGA